MSEFTASELEELLNDGRELHVVLDSDREYVLHGHDTEFENGRVKTRGIPEDGTDYLRVTFPVSAVEHYYLHDEV